MLTAALISILANYSRKGKSFPFEVPICDLNLLSPSQDFQDGRRSSDDERVARRHFRDVEEAYLLTVEHFPRLPVLEFNLGVERNAPSLSGELGVELTLEVSGVEVVVDSDFPDDQAILLPLYRDRVLDGSGQTLLDVLEIVL